MVTVGRIRRAMRRLVRTRAQARGAGGPRARSVLFLRNSYYHFHYLAEALRRRGWDALTVSTEDPDGPHSQYYHGEDVNLWDPDPKRFRRNIEEFYWAALERFALLHLAGDGLLTFFLEDSEAEEPWDIVEWRRRGHKIAYTISGCNSGVAQSTVARWSALGGSVVCDKCPWQLRPDVCSDAKNLGWGRKVDRYCDVIFTEGTPALDYQAIHKAVREPTTMCLNPEFWKPDLTVPAPLKIERAEDELLVYHSFGNYDLRTVGGRNIKGTGAVRAAVSRLQAEGMAVKLVVVTDVKSTEVRYLQVQADVIVDQLNYGRYGATAREAMMLGKPTICYINRREAKPADVLRSTQELPLVSATEETIYEVLRDLLLDREGRGRLGAAGRAFAMKWHSADACAERYETIYDSVMSEQFGGQASKPETEEACRS
jgi:hypothetical protein